MIQEIGSFEENKYNNLNILTIGVKNKININILKLF
jgi:hypothetical protein